MIDRVPTVVGYNEAADVLLKIFADVQEIRIADQLLDAREKELSHDRLSASFLPSQLVQYQFVSPYRGVSQDQYKRWRTLKTDQERHAFAQAALVGHLLMVFKGLGIWLADDQRIVAYPFFRTTLVRMKGQKMTAFTGHFVANVELPDLIGIGKGTSRGFGTVKKEPGTLGLPYQ
jgi:hypothetical protein